ARLTEECRPIGTSEAKKIGFIDDCFGSDAAEFERILRVRAAQLSKREDFWRLPLHEVARYTRAADQRRMTVDAIEAIKRTETGKPSSEVCQNPLKVATMSAAGQ